MADLKRLLGAATKALGDPSSGSSARNGSSSRSSGGWRYIVRQVSDRVVGDERGSAPQPGGGRTSTTDYAPSSGVPAPAAAGFAATTAGSAADRTALARYDYLLHTAPPQQLEQVHRDAFERLTPEQREQVLSRLRAASTPAEAPASSAPADLARAATRGEATSPGFMKKVFGAATGASGSRGGSRLGGADGVAGGALAGAGIAAAGGLALAVAGGAVASAVAGPILADAIGAGVDFESLASGAEGLLGSGVEGFLGDGASALAEGGEVVGGFGDSLSGLGDSLGDIPGLGDLFGR